MSANTHSESERRLTTRRPLNENIKIRVIDEKLEVIGKCCNLSDSGMLVHCKSQINVGAQLNLSLPNEDIGFDAEGEVIRTVQDGDLYLIAIKLSDIKT